jgi:hypothetical protein
VSRELEPVVPAPVRRCLQDEPERYVGLTILVLSELESGWPHLAMVSVGELVVAEDGRLALALWPTSTCAANLSRAARATLGVVVDGLAFSLRCRVDDELSITTDEDPERRAFVLRVAAATKDSAPYAQLLSGVTYRLHDAQATLARWRRTRAALAAVLAERGALEVRPAHLDRESRSGDACDDSTERNWGHV